MRIGRPGFVFVVIRLLFFVRPADWQCPNEVWASMRIDVCVCAFSVCCFFYLRVDSVMYLYFHLIRILFNRKRISLSVLLFLAISSRHICVSALPVSSHDSFGHTQSVEYVVLLLG